MSSIAEGTITMGSTATSSHTVTMKKSPMVKAIEANEVDKVLELIRKNGSSIVEEEDEYGRTPIMICCERGTFEMFNILLASEANLSKRDSTLQTSLHHACQHANYKIIERLIILETVPTSNSSNSSNTSDENGNKSTSMIKSRDIYLNTPLHLLVGTKDTKDKKKIIEEMIHKIETGYSSPHKSSKHPLQVASLEFLNSRNIDGMTPLQLACLNNRIDTVTQLIGKGVDIDSQNNSGESALHISSKHGYKKIIKLLLEKGANPLLRDKSGHVAAEVAYSSNPNVISPGSTTSSVITHSSSGGSNSMPLSLSASIHSSGSGGGSSINPTSTENKEKEKIVAALMKKSEEIIKRSLESIKLIVNDDDILKELLYSVESGDYVQFIAIQKLYTFPGKKLVTMSDSQGRTLLMIACLNGQWQIANDLIKSGSNINTVDKEGNNALLFSACCSNHSVFSLVLSQKDINVNHKNADGNTCLHMLAKNVSFPQNSISEFISSLVQKGFDVNSQNINGETPVHVSVWKGSFYFTRELLESGKADPNIQTNNGETPLHFAVRNMNVEMVQLLITTGQAKLDIESPTDGTPLKLANSLFGTSGSDNNNKKPTEETKTKDKIIALLGGKPKFSLTQSVPKSPSDTTVPSQPGPPIDPGNKRTLFQQLLAGKKIEQQKPEKTLVHQSTKISINFEAHSGIDLSFNWAINGDEVEVGEEIGAGKFGKVFRAIYRNQTVAVKVLENTVSSSTDEIKKEFDIMSSMRSPHIVYFYGMILKPQVCMVMMCCENGSLASVLKNPNFRVTWDHVYKWAIQMVKGVDHLHNWKPQIIHRDLKTLNLLVDEFYNAVVSDFGISRFVVDENLSTLTKLRGTYSYCAPELYLGGQASTKSDVYSIGIVLWELATRCITNEYTRPYSEYKGLVMEFSIIIQVAKNNIRPTIHADTPAPLSFLIKKCWDAVPEKRATCKEILKTLYELKRAHEPQISLSSLPPISDPQN